MTATSARFLGQCCRPRRPQRGVALVVGLLLVTVTTVLALSAVAMAALELQMAGNEQHQEQAFRAAEAGIEQAIAAGAFSMDPVAIAATYDQTGAVDPVPIRGSGTPIAGCADPRDPDIGPCEYFVRYDLATGATPVPGADLGADPDERAFHFVIDSFGVAGRGANSHQVQGIYVVGRVGDALTARPVRAYWYQRGIDPDQP